MGTVSPETKVRGPSRRNLPHNPALSWVPTIDLPGTQAPSRPRSVLRGSGHERSHLSAHRRQQLGQLPEPGMLLGPQALGGLGFQRTRLPYSPQVAPSFGSLPGRVFLQQAGVSARERCRGGGGTLQTEGAAALREPTAPPAGQMQERAGPEQGKTDKDPETAGQVVQSRLVIYLSHPPGSCHTTLWGVLSRLPPP